MNRTLSQNAALHKYCQDVANELNEAGLDMRKVLKPGISIPWSKNSVKRHLWRPIQEAMFDKLSTTKLESKEVSEVYEVLNRHMAEKFGISVEFPSKGE